MSQTDRHRRYDKKRQGSEARLWYKSAAWKIRRRDQLSAHPTCAYCENVGLTRIATVCDHEPPHNGDWMQFFHGPLFSCCKACHDGYKQRIEARGFSTEVGEDGWPTDPRNPQITGGAVPKHRNKR